MVRCGDLRLPIGAGLLQISFIVLFGVFVQYDPKLGMPIIPTTVAATTTTSLGASPTMTSANDSDGSHETETTLEHIGKYYAMFQDIHVMMFIGFGFLMTFLKRYGFSSVGLNFLVAAFVLQWATLTKGWIRHFDLDTKKIPVNIESLIEADFCSATILISFGAVLGKVSPIQLIVMALIEVVLFQVNEFIVFDKFEATDSGDSMVVHTFGAYFGLAVAGVLYSPEVESAAHDKEKSVYHSDLFSMIGTVFLWLFWPSFNAGTALKQGQLRAVINTYYSLTASAVVTFVVSALVNKGKFNMVHIQNSTLAGGVAIGTLADLIIQPWASLLVGSVAAIVSVLGYNYLTPAVTKYLRIHDTCGVHNLHGMPGIISAIGGIIAAGLATPELYGDGLQLIFNKNASTAHLAGMQAAALGTSFGIAVVGGVVTGFILRIPIWNQPTTENHIMDDAAYWLLPDEDDSDVDQGHSSRHQQQQQQHQHSVTTTSQVYINHANEFNSSKDVTF